MRQRIANLNHWQKTFYLLLISFSIIGILSIFYATIWGIGLYGWDSFSYVSVARSIAMGRGFVYPIEDNYYAPLTHFPPLLSTILASFEIAGIDALRAAKLLNALLFGYSIVLFGLLIKRTINSLLFVALGTFLFTTSAILIELYSLAMSEGLFLTLTLLSFLLLDKYITHNGWFSLIILSIVIGCAALTRYVGIVNIITGILAILLLKKEKRISRKLRDIFLLGAISFTPLLLWTWRNYTLTTTINNRGIEYHPLVLNNYLNAFYTFLNWYLPEDLVIGYEKEVVFISLGIVLVLIIFAYFYTRSHTKYILSSWKSSIRNLHSLNIISVIYVVCYLFAIFISKTFLDPGTGMTNRIFSPVLVISLFLTINLLNYAWKIEIRAIRGIVLLMISYLLIFSTYNTVQSIPEIHRTGMGLGRKALHNSESIQLLSKISDQTPIFNNNPYAVYFYSGRVGNKIKMFSQEGNSHGEAIIAIFGSPEEYKIQEKYSGNILLLQSDNIATIYLYQP
jgi:4-amino-4-deoxy-L-arabinose transferase-like glycosyltransferase